jgi:PhnB protein
MAKATSPIPAGYHSLSPHLIITAGAAKYIEFLTKAFGAKEVIRNAGPGGKLFHAQVKIGDSSLSLADHFPEMGSQPIVEGNWPLVLTIYVPDCDATWATAVAAGCKEKFPLKDQFWGDRYGQVQDPFGFTWAIATHTEDLTMEEIGARQAKLFGGAGAS